MNANNALSLESRFGPPSDPIIISTFIQEALSLHSASSTSLDDLATASPDDIEYAYNTPVQCVTIHYSVFEV